MDDLIKTFHIDWKLLAAQIINFGVVLAVLILFALKPLMKIMKDREKKIADGVKYAEEMTEKMTEIEALKEAEVTKGRKEAQMIIRQGEKELAEIRQEKLERIVSEAEKMVKDARRQIREERNEMVGEVKSELGSLIALALNKVTVDVIDKKTHMQLIDEVIDNLEKEAAK